MPTFAPYPSTNSQPYPTFLPPALKALRDPKPRANLDSLPPSKRYSGTLQDELDALENDEDDFYGHMLDVRHYGNSWLVPLGRQHTHDEDVESALSSSPRGDPNGTFDLGPPLDLNGGPGAGPAAGGGDGAPEAPIRDLDAEIEDADESDSGSENASGSEGNRSASEGGGGGRGGVSPASGRGGSSEIGEESMQILYPCAQRLLYCWRKEKTASDISSYHATCSPRARVECLCHGSALATRASPAFHGLVCLSLKMTFASRRPSRFSSPARRPTLAAHLLHKTTPLPHSRTQYEFLRRRFHARWFSGRRRVFSRRWKAFRHPVSSPCNHSPASRRLAGLLRGRVSLVACIRNVTVSATQVTMLIEDGTGQMDARSWLDPSSEDGGQRDEWQVNSYVRIIGTLKTFSTKRHINVNRCRKVEDYNEILFHPLECIFVHKFYANHGQLPGQSASAINSTTYDSGNNPYAGDGGATSNDGGGGGGGAEPYADLPSGQRRIMQFVSDLVANGTAGDEGVNVNQIVRGVGGPHGKIQEEVKNLINDGHLYETIDDDHVLPTAS